MLASDLFELVQDTGDVFLLSTGEKTGWTTEELAGDNMCEGEVVTIPWGKSRPVNEVIKYYKGKFITADNRIATSIDTTILLNKYLFYWMLNEGGTIDKFYRGSGIKHPSMNDVLNMKIPLPPLPVQEEIVRILDNFTELTAVLTSELTTELAARRKQHEYYRAELMIFGDELEWRALGEVAEFKYGYTDRAKDTGTARFIRITDIGDNGKLKETDCKYIDLSKESQEYLLQKNDLLMARTGATYGKTMLYSAENPAVYASFLIRIRFPNKEVLPAYYWHFAQSKLYWYQANKLVSTAGQPQFNANVLKVIQIPLRTLEDQQRIVEKLDHFDALFDDIRISLVDEIMVVQKQYKYYRDKLLTFKEKEVREDE